jgi:hypothetical protein
MEEITEQIAYYENCLRLERRARRRAYLKLALLRVFEWLGFAWANNAANEQHWIIDSSRYGEEEHHECLRRLQEYGTTTVGFIIFPEESGCDGWLPSEDIVQF